MATGLRRIFSSPIDINDQADRVIAEGIAKQFPIENKDYRIEIEDVIVDKKNFDHLDEKSAILKSKSLTYPIRGTLVLKDKKTGKRLDEVKNFPLADSFSITDKHTLVYKGNNYSVSNLIQLMPGVYTRSKDTGHLEASINTGTGQSFSVTLDPKSQTFHAEIGSSKVPLAPLLKDVLGVGETEAARYIPGDVWKTNLNATKGKEEKAIGSMYTRLVSRKLQDKDASFEDKKVALKGAIESSKLHPITTKITLGKEKNFLDKEALLISMKNLVEVHQGVRVEDNRDSLEFKRVQNLPDLLRRRFDAERRHETVEKAVGRIGFNLEKIDPKAPKLKGIVPAKPFNKIYRDFVVRSQLSSTPTETNPIESLESVGKVTVLGKGEGGIGSDRAVPMSARNIDPSHLGILDPSRTPESGHAGIDQRFTISSMRDDEGLLYAEVIDAKTNKRVSLSAQKMMKSVIGFPHQEGKKTVQAQVNGKLQEVARSRVQYWVPDGSDAYTITTNLIPFLNSNHPGRLTMAGKAITQALSLENREAPLVQTLSANDTPFVESLGNMISTASHVDGEVVHITDKEIHVKTKKGKKEKINLIKNLPFNMKGFHDDTPAVKVGDSVKRGDIVADNNYTKKGDFALGRNLYVGYMPYKGYNHEDGLVISRSAASSLRSLHSYKYDYSVKRDTVDNKAMFKRYFPSVFTADQLAKLDNRGYVKKGAKLSYGDPVYAVLEKRELSVDDKAFGRLHKTLVNPYRKTVQVWDHEEAGEVVDAHTDSKDIRILTRSVKPLEEGDKLTGLHGNKGVVSIIVEDEDMPASKTTGKPLDLILNPASVTSRVNLGQIHETIAGKIAQKLGKPYLVKNFSSENNLTKLKGEMEEHGISDTDVVVDPNTGREYGSILAGPQYFLKLSKTTDSNYSARNVGKYDAYLQPSKGGGEGSKSVGFMEFLGLLGSDARKNLREIGTVKAEGGEGSQSTEFWDRFMRGQALPKPKTTFATKKFFDHLRGAGVQVKTIGDKIVASPMTDTDILSKSRGELTQAKVLAAKDGKPEKGGLYDQSITGGLRGKHWGHYSLAEPIVNPMFEKPVKDLLGLNTREFDGLVAGKISAKRKASGEFTLTDTSSGKILREIQVGAMSKKADALSDSFNEMIGALSNEGDESEEGLVGGPALEAMMADLDVDQELSSSKDAYTTAKSVSKKNTLVKKMKYLKGLQDQGFSSPDKAFMLRNIPVIPPIMRPAIDQGANRTEYADVNYLYQHHMIVNDRTKQIIDKLPASMLTQQRKDLYEGAKAITGLGDPITYQHKKKGVKGLITSIAGETSPKKGMFHDKLLSRKQDFSGRATIKSSPELKFNEAEVPKDQLWTMYKMHIIRDLVRNGHALPEAKKAWESHTRAATNSFNKLIKDVPVIINRAPTLMKTNIMAVFPVPVNHKTIGINPLHLSGFAADFDGDAMSMYVPMTREAVNEAKEKLLPQSHLSDARKGFGVPMFSPGHEAILGSVYLTEPDATKKPKQFKSEREALNALKNNEISVNDPISIKGK